MIDDLCSTFRYRARISIFLGRKQKKLASLPAPPISRKKKSDLYHFCPTAYTMTVFSANYLFKQVGPKQKVPDNWYSKDTHAAQIWFR
jgi:hypothetical protein